MGKYIGLDLGTTSISGLILDTESKAVLLHRNISNNSEITTSENKTKTKPINKVVPTKMEEGKLEPEEIQDQLTEEEELLLLQL